MLIIFLGDVLLDCGTEGDIVCSSEWQLENVVAMDVSVDCVQRCEDRFTYDDMTDELGRKRCSSQASTSHAREPKWSNMLIMSFVEFVW